MAQLTISIRLQELAAAENKEMQKVRLFSEEEIRKMQETRQAHEQAIGANPENLSCIEQFINSQKYDYSNIAMRREQRKIKIDPTKANVEYILIRRMTLLYNYAIERFPDDNELLLSYFKFCRKFNVINGASDTISVLLAKSPENPNTWRCAATWYADDCKTKNDAVLILLRGLHKHPTHQPIYKDLIKLDLNEIVQSKNEQSQKVFIGRIQSAVKQAFHHIEDLEFYISLLEMLEPHTSTVVIQNLIFDYLKRDVNNSEIVWHLLAQREQNDYYCTCETVEGEMTVRPLKRTPKARLEACFKKYEEGLAVTSKDRKQHLWWLYIDFLFKMQDEPGVATILKSQTLEEALHNASTEGYLEEDHYCKWISMFSDVENYEDGLRIAEKGTAAIPHSELMWVRRLQLQLIMDHDRTRADAVFRMGLAKLNMPSKKLWMVIIPTLIMVDYGADPIPLFEEGIRQPEQIAQMIKPIYLEYTFLHKGLQQAQALYFRLAQEKPYCKELYMKMHSIHSVEKKNFDFWLKFLKLGCQQFGETDSDVWMNYASYYLRFHRVPGFQKEVDKIYQDARSTLSTDAFSLYETEYKEMLDQAGKQSSFLTSFKIT